MPPHNDNELIKLKPFIHEGKLYQKLIYLPFRKANRAVAFSDDAQSLLIIEVNSPTDYKIKCALAIKSIENSTTDHISLESSGNQIAFVRCFKDYNRVFICDWVKQSLYHVDLPVGETLKALALGVPDEGIGWRIAYIFEFKGNYSVCDMLKDTYTIRYEDERNKQETQFNVHYEYLPHKVTHPNIIPAGPSRKVAIAISKDQTLLIMSNDSQKNVILNKKPPSKVDFEEISYLVANQCNANDLFGFSDQGRLAVIATEGEEEAALHVYQIEIHDALAKDPRAVSLETSLKSYSPCRFVPTYRSLPTQSTSKVNSDWKLIAFLETQQERLFTYNDNADCFLPFKQVISGNPAQFFLVVAGEKNPKKIYHSLYGPNDLRDSLYIELNLPGKDLSLITDNIWEIEDNYPYYSFHSDKKTWEAENQAYGFYHLPRDVCWLVLCLLSYEDLTQLALVSKKFYNFMCPSLIAITFSHPHLSLVDKSSATILPPPIVSNSSPALSWAPKKDFPEAKAVLTSNSDQFFIITKDTQLNSQNPPKKSWFSFIHQGNKPKDNQLKIIKESFQGEKFQETEFCPFGIKKLAWFSNGQPSQNGDALFFLTTGNNIMKVVKHYLGKYSCVDDNFDITKNSRIYYFQALKFGVLVLAHKHGSWVAYWNKDSGHDWQNKLFSFRNSLRPNTSSIKRDSIASAMHNDNQLFIVLPILAGFSEMRLYVYDFHRNRVLLTFQLLNLPLPKRSNPFYDFDLEDEPYSSIKSVFTDNAEKLFVFYDKKLYGFIMKNKNTNEINPTLESIQDIGESALTMVVKNEFLYLLTASTNSPSDPANTLKEINGTLWQINWEKNESTKSAQILPAELLYPENKIELFIIKNQVQLKMHIKKDNVVCLYDSKCVPNNKLANHQAEQKNNPFDYEKILVNIQDKLMNKPNWCGLFGGVDVTLHLSTKNNQYKQSRVSQGGYEILQAIGDPIKEDASNKNNLYKKKYTAIQDIANRKKDQHSFFSFRQKETQQLYKDIASGKFEKSL